MENDTYNDALDGDDLQNLSDQEAWMDSQADMAELQDDFEGDEGDFDNAEDETDLGYERDDFEEYLYPPDYE